jgi:hypothetical protein
MDEPQSLSGFGGEEKLSPLYTHRKSNPGSPSRSLLTIMTELPPSHAIYTLKDLNVEIFRNDLRISYAADACRTTELHEAKVVCVCAASGNMFTIIRHFQVEVIGAD